MILITIPLRPGMLTGLWKEIYSPGLRVIFPDQGQQVPVDIIEIGKEIMPIIITEGIGQTGKTIMAHSIFQRIEP